MDSEWWKTPRFIYGKVLGSSGKFRVKPRKVRNILEGGGTGLAGPAPPGEAHQGLAGQGQAEWGSESFPPSMQVGEGEESLLPTPSGVFSFLSYLASWSLNWFGQET